MKKNAVTLIVAAALLVIFALLLFTYQVRQSEVVVISRFQKPTALKTEPGLYFKWPWPVDSIHRFDARTQTFEDKFSENLLTGDGTMLLAHVFVGWKISDAMAFFPKFPGGSTMEAQRQLENMVRSAKAAAIGKHSLSDIVNSDASQLKLDQIEKDIKASVEAELAKNNYGISIEFLGIKRIGLPENVTQAVFDRMKAERTKLISKAKYEGEAQATNIISAAERQAANVLSAAQASARRIEGQGVAEAAKTLSVFQQNPDLAIFQLQLEALKSSVNQKTTLIFDEQTPPFDLFKKLSETTPAK
jgi:membrane protease subunit HflC